MGLIDHFWIREFFNCDSEDFYDGKNIICQHCFLKDYNGFFILKINHKFVISSPIEYINKIEKVINENINFFDKDIWHSLLGNDFDCIVGPAWLSYCTQLQTYKNQMICRKLNLEDEKDIEMLNELNSECDETEWEHSSISLDSEAIFVQVDNNKILSAAGYSTWGNKIAHVGIITHPSYRRMGYAQNVLRYLTNYGLEKGLIMQYRTLSSNLSAIKAAEKCGYDFYANHISVRIKKNNYI